MRVNFNPRLLLGLTCLLAACGGGGGGGETPSPTPSPTPPLSSVSGILSSPGALGPSSQAAGGWRVGESWWTDPAAVAARRTARGVGPQSLIPGEFIVKRRAGLGAQALSTRRVGTTTLRRERALGLPGVALYRVTAGAGVNSAGVDAATLARQLQAQPDVEYAQPNRYLHALRTPNDTHFSLQWDAQAMGLPAAWDVTTGQNVTVAVVDSGIVNHPDFGGRLLPGLDIIQDPAVAGDGDGVDLDPTDPGDGTSFHGSHVAGTVAAASNNGLGIAGVSWGARILPIRALGASGSGSLDDILIGTYWAAGGEVEGLPVNPNPAGVVNLSLGGPGPCGDVEQDLFRILAEAGVITVVAAGNENVDAGGVSPANCRNVITVGATGPDGKRAPYSNHGARIDVMAPGGNTELLLNIGGQRIPGGILSTVADVDGNGKLVAAYGILEGTSMAAPHVAGLVALMKGEQPGLTTAQALARLKASGTPLSDTHCGVRAGCGAGLVNAAAALGAGAPGPSPVLPVPAPVGEVRTFVAALYRLTTGYDEDRSRAVTVDQKTLRNPYALAGLEPGRYNVAAWQDLDGDEEVDDGEPFGVFSDPVTGSFDVTVDAVARNIIGIDIKLEPYRAAGQTRVAARSSTPLKALAAAAETASQEHGHGKLESDW